MFGVPGVQVSGSDEHMQIRDSSMPQKGVSG
jgi:hypothetical protein